MIAKHQGAPGAAPALRRCKFFAGEGRAHAFLKLPVPVRVEQLMQMNNKIAHMRIVDGLLRFGPPGKLDPDGDGKF